MANCPMMLFKQQNYSMLVQKQQTYLIGKMIISIPSIIYITYWNYKSRCVDLC